MPGGLLQLVAVGAQNELVNGNPSMTHFRAVYRRHTNFAMEHIRMTFTNSNLEFTTTGTKTIQCRIDRYAQLLHDTYLSVTLPNIWSPLVYVGNTLPSGYGAGGNINANSIGYEFQWIQNIGYNLIDHVDLVMNGQVIQSLTGEWMKMYSYLTHDATKRAIIDQMVGNVPELYDPANAYDRQGQYPHAVTPVNIPSTIPMTTTPEPSIRSRQLIIPLHFFFCENPGLALPLVSLQNSEVYINVTLRNLNDLYTVIDVNPSSPTYGTRVKPTGDKTYNAMNLFLSAPLSNGTPSSPNISTWFPDTYLEGNFIYLTEMEMNQLARADQVYLIKNVNYINNTGQFGANTDLLLPMFNLITRIVFGSQRSDKILTNDWDNYTNWNTTNRAPFTPYSSDPQTAMYTSGQQQITSVFPKDTIADALLLFDGKERFQTKTIPFFSLLQMYRHSTGTTQKLPGVYMYSFALDNDSYQPSGAVNGSMFNKIILRTTLQQPLPAAGNTATSTQVCILKSSAFSPNPVVIPPAQLSLYTPDQLLTVVQTNDNVTFVYTYNAFAYVESINFLRIVSGLANLVFAS